MPNSPPVIKVIGKPNGEKVHKYITGQNTVGSGYCIATNLNGSACMEKQTKKNIPYCDKCIQEGDPSLGVVPHPRFGRMLIAKRELPSGYRMGLFGNLCNDKEMPTVDEEWGFETTIDDLTINPCTFPGSFVQFSQCPGPHEKVSITFAPKTELVEPVKKGKKHDKYGTMMFWTTTKVPKNAQLNMMYAGGVKETNEFFAERGITRCDVWTKEHPTILKAGVQIKDLMTMPPKPASERERIQIFEGNSVLANDKFKEWDAKNTSKYTKGTKNSANAVKTFGHVADGRVKWELFDESFKTVRVDRKKKEKAAAGKGKIAMTVSSKSSSGKSNMGKKNATMKSKSGSGKAPMKGKSSLMTPSKSMKVSKSMKMVIKKGGGKKK